MKESQLIQRQPWYREMMGRTFNIFVRILHLPGIKDTQCGFKMLTKQAAGAALPHCRERGFAFDVELLYWLKKLGFRIKEQGVIWSDDKDSKVTILKGPVAMFAALIKLRLKTIFIKN